MTESTTMTDSITSRSDAQTEPAGTEPADDPVLDAAEAPVEPQDDAGRGEAPGDLEDAEALEGPDELEHPEEGEHSGADDPSAEGSAEADEDRARRRAPRA